MSRSEIITLHRQASSSEPPGTNLTSGCTFTGVSGVIGPGVAALTRLFWVFAPTTNQITLLERLRITFTCVTSFTTPITATRAIGLFALHTLAIGPVSSMMSARSKAGLNGNVEGQQWLCNTTPYDISADAPTMNRMIVSASLAAFGNAGDHFEKVWEWHTGSASMIRIPSSNGGSAFGSDGIGIASPSGMDAGGQFIIGIEADVAFRDTI